ncbi:DUF3617 domain-containing protein [Sphingomonas xanthus]|uniref:DUF3617 domain-containing protein n=1 Tax=Sphingomonas xanthus TaxID=2594473 RepID=A0A516IQW7_9SPHN|nr:DUF3617 domain-containing protein [Sphingomonas xanthus]QDP19295.1 DUF3617 domain-containing protein [Sphingomonas xanthus]
MNRLLLTLGALAIAGCNSEPEVEATNASIEEVAAEVREAGGSAMIVRPGLWQSTAELESIDVPGMPPAAAEQIKKTMASAVSGHKSCLTAEQVQKPSEDFFAGQNSNCRYDRFSMKNGRMSGVMRCAQQGGSQLIEFDGSYSPDEYQMRMASTVEGAAGPGGPMKMVMRMSSKRIGDCTPGSDAAAN